MIAFYGRRCVKHASNVQSMIALSTGESEYYALVKGGGGATGLGLQSLLADFGIKVGVLVEGDSNAAKGQRTELDSGRQGISRHATCGCKNE